MTLHFLPPDEPDPRPIRLVEPPIVALPCGTVSVWPYGDDYVLAIGTDAAPNDTILIPRHLLTATWMTLRAADE